MAASAASAANSVRQAEAVAAEANRKLKVLSLGLPPSSPAPTPASPSSADGVYRLASASRRAADASSLAVRLDEPAASRHAAAQLSGFGGSPRAFEYRDAGRAAGGGSPARVAAASAATPRAASNAAEAAHLAAAFEAQQQLSTSLHFAGGVASPRGAPESPSWRSLTAASAAYPGSSSPGAAPVYLDPWRPTGAAA